MGTNGITEEVYSNDGRFYVGQSKYSISGINKRLLFDIADRNDDNMLDEKEIRRYNSPILTESKPPYNFTSLGLFTDKSKDYISNGGMLLHSYRPSDTYQDYYAGLKKEELTDEFCLKRFDTIDLNQDEELDEKEMELIEKIHQGLGEVSEMSRGVKTISTIVGAGGGLLGFAIGFGAKKGGSGKMGLVGAAAGVLLGVVLRLVCGKLIGEVCNEKLGELKDHPYAKERINYLK